MPLVFDKKRHQKNNQKNLYNILTKIRQISIIPSKSSVAAQASCGGDENSTRKEVQVMKTIDVTVAVLLVIGGLNWGLVGVADFNLVAALFGEGTTMSRIVYSLVGLSAVYQAIQVKGIQHRWGVDAEKAHA
jgi:uncharacterized protein